ncbi:unnamed protein product, partial [marine sediment metagenome]
NIFMKQKYFSALTGGGKAADKQSLHIYPEQRVLKAKIKFRDFPVSLNFYEVVR